LDKRQDNLGQVSSFQASQPEEAAHGEEKSRQHASAAQPFIPVSRQSFLMSNRLAFGRQPDRSAGSGASQQ